MNCCGVVSVNDADVTVLPSASAIVMFLTSVPDWSSVMFQDCSAVLPFILESVHAEPPSSVSVSVPSTFDHSMDVPLLLLAILALIELSPALGSSFLLESVISLPSES